MPIEYADAETNTIDGNLIEGFKREVEELRTTALE